MQEELYQEELYQEELELGKTLFRIISNKI